MSDRLDFGGFRPSPFPPPGPPPIIQILEYSYIPVKNSKDLKAEFRSKHRGIEELGGWEVGMLGGGCWMAWIGWRIARLIALIGLISLIRGSASQ